MTYALAVGLGTMHTRAAITVQVEPHLLVLEEYSQETTPSAVWLDPRGSWQVGAGALAHAPQRPEAFDPAPLRSAGEDRMLLGGELIPVANALGALVTLAVVGARRAVGSDPRDVRLTYPVHWGTIRRQALEQAARSAGLEDVTTIAEPVAAAARLCGRGVAAGRRVAILDFGGATFTASVLRSTPSGLELAAPAVVRDLGGDDVDALIMDYLQNGQAGSHPDWENLVSPGDERQRRDALDLRSAVRRAKEQLSDRVAAMIEIPALQMEIQLTRAELDQLMLPVIDQAVDLAQLALDSASVTADSLAGLYLIGGSSRIPLFADRVWERLNVQPEVPAEPEAASVLGAALGVAGHRFEHGSHFRGRLAANTASPLWRFGNTGGADLSLYGDGMTVRASDSPGEGPDVAALAATADRRLATAGNGYASMALVPAQVLGRDGGLERSYSVVQDGRRVTYLEWYLQLGERWIVVSAPEQAREVVSRLVVETPRSDPARFFELRIGADVPGGWIAAERLFMVRPKSVHQLVAESDLSPDPEDSLRHDSGWFARRFPSPRYAETARGRSRFFSGIDAMTVTLRDSADGSYTRVWAGLVDGRGYRIVATVPWTERLGLPLVETLMLVT
jgi:actin-like ATPase involved in cell morphogenesis